MNTKHKEYNKTNTIKYSKTQRRKFLKKTLYATPTIIMLGTILKPTKANAYIVPSDIE